MTATPTNRSPARYVRWAVSIAFFVFLFLFVRKGQLLEKFQDLDVRYFTLSFAIVPLMVGMSCLKWKVLLDHQGDRLGFWSLMKFYVIGYFFTNILPTSVGGDFARSYYAGRRISNQTHAAVSVFLERFTGLLLLLVLAIGAPALKPELYRDIAVLVPVGCAVGLLVAIFCVWRMKEPLKIPDAIVRGFFRWWRRRGVLDRLAARLEAAYGRFHQAIDGFHEKLMVAGAELGKSPWVLLQVVFLTLLFYFMTWVNVYLAFRTFSVAPSFLEMAAVVPVIMLAFLLPISVGNLGLAEGAYVGYFLLIGIEPAASLAMALFMRFKLLCNGLIGYLFYVTNKDGKVDLEEIKQHAPTR